MGKRRNDIPEGWLCYKNMGSPIPGTPFVAFKVPLGEERHFRLRNDSRFTPQILLESYPNIGLVIDLTNTHRYYDPAVIADAGVMYKKLASPGGIVPTPRLIKIFCDTVNRFVDRASEGSLVGVHCTHGINRTGFLICYFMIRHLNINPPDALLAFERARGHGIERKPFIDTLLNMAVNPSVHPPLESPPQDAAHVGGRRKKPKDEKKDNKNVPQVRSEVKRASSAGGSRMSASGVDQPAPEPESSTSPVQRNTPGDRDVHFGPGASQKDDKEDEEMDSNNTKRGRSDSGHDESLKPASSYGTHRRRHHGLQPEQQGRSKRSSREKWWTNAPEGRSWRGSQGQSWGGSHGGSWESSQKGSRGSGHEESWRQRGWRSSQGGSWGNDQGRKETGEGRRSGWSRRRYQEDERDWAGGEECWANFRGADRSNWHSKDKRSRKD